MKKEKPKKFDIAKAGIVSGLLIAMVMGGFILYNAPGVVDKPLEFAEPNENEYEESWHTILKMTMKDGELVPLGEFAQSGSGFCSIFLLDYAETPFTVLKENGTDWEAAVGTTVQAYADADTFSEDTPSEDPFFIVVRARFERDVAYDATRWMGNRTKVTITFSGDESGTITHYCNETDGVTGGGVASDNDSSNYSFYANYWYDDNDDGYRITDDGSLTVSLIEISAKY